MNSGILKFLSSMLESLRDLAPIILVIAFFQIFVLQQPPDNVFSLLIGTLFVVLGLTFFVSGLEMGLFPIGETMAHAFAIGMSTTIAEPSLIAVAIKAKEVSGVAIGTWGLRIAVALGVAIGIALGTYRIVTGTPLHYYIMAGYVIVIVQTFFAPKIIVPLAYDSGGVTTSTVTVPLVAALGLGLAETVPGRSPLIDGFGLIAFASLFPMISVMAYAQLSEYRVKRAKQELMKQEQHDRDLSR